MPPLLFFISTREEHSGRGRLRKLATEPKFVTIGRVDEGVVFEVVDLMVSRLGLEPRALALKGQIERLLHKMMESD